MKYQINSDRIAGHNRGDVVDADDLGSANIDALVAAGHLVEQATPKRAKTDTTDNEGLTEDV